MSDTPRTDARVRRILDNDGPADALEEFARQLERELTDAKHRIRTLIEERDSARIQANHKWKLRQEFEALLGTDDVGVGVDQIKQAKRELTEARTRIKELADIGGALADLVGCGCHDGGCKTCRRAVNDWNETVKRCLEGIE